MFAILSGLFAGPAASVTSWFASAFGKLIGVLAILAIIVACGTSVYFNWEGAIKDAANAKIAIVRQKELIDSKNKEIQVLKDTEALKDQKIQEQAKVIGDINLQSDSVQAWIAQKKGTAGGDREASDIIKETFKQLYGSIEK